MSGKQNGARAMARCQAWLNVVDYLWWVSLGPGTRPVEWFPSDTPGLPIKFRHAGPQARYHRVRPGQVLSGLTHPPLLTD
jgi:hypothetical protein